MRMNKSVVCRSCKHLCGQICVENETLPPNYKEECWKYRSKTDIYNLAQSSDERSEHRLP